MPQEAPSPLSGEWINDRIIAVIEKITKKDGLLDHLLDDRLLSSDYLPMEVPLDGTLLRRMQDGQVEGMLQGISQEEVKAGILAKLAEIDKDRTNVV